MRAAQEEKVLPTLARKALHRHTDMRAQHTAHSFPAFPVYSCAFIADDLVVVGAGGGASRTGIKNKLRLFRVSDDRKLHTLSELELEKGEDAPMSMVAHPQNRTLVCGINSNAEMVEKQENTNCRQFSVSPDEHKFSLLATCSTLASDDGSDDYQRVTVLSPNGRCLVVAGAHDFSVLNYDGLFLVASTTTVSKGEIYDATLSSSHLFLTTSSSILVYPLPTHANDEELDINSYPPSVFNEKLRVIKTVDVPSISGLPPQSNITFRAARLHPGRDDTLYTVVNVTLPRAKREKLAKKRAYVLKWSISKKDDSINVHLETTRKICDGNLTCFDASPDGRLLAFGASDLSLGVLDSSTLTPLLSILKAHEFPITTLRFSPTSKLLVSGGVDSSIRVVSIPELLGGQSWTAIIFIVIAILVFFIAIWMRQ